MLCWLFQMDTKITSISFLWRTFTVLRSTILQLMHTPFHSGVKLEASLYRIKLRHSHLCSCRQTSKSGLDADTSLQVLFSSSCVMCIHSDKARFSHRGCEREETWLFGRTWLNITTPLTSESACATSFTQSRSRLHRGS